jgi:hypothetical protein
MKTKSRFRGLRFFLATCASVACACICVLLIAGEYHTARFQLDTHERESQGWEAFRKTNPAYFEANAEAVRSCQRNLNEARDNSWVKLSKTHLAGLFVAAGLGSAAGSYLATWGVLWLVGAAIDRFARWLAMRFRCKPKKRLRTQSVCDHASWRTSPPSAPHGVQPSGVSDETSGKVPRSENPALVRHSTVRWENRTSQCKVQN